MGLLFWKKKKVPKVPLPEGKFTDDKALRFSARGPSEKLELKEIQEAVGFDKPMAFPEEELEEETPSPVKFKKEELLFPSPGEETPARFNQGAKFPGVSEDLYVKVDVYRRIIGESDLLKKDLIQLQEINKNLDSSEFNEDKNFNKLRRLMKGLHDNLLAADKTLFKS